MKDGKFVVVGFNKLRTKLLINLFYIFEFDPRHLWTGHDCLYFFSPKYRHSLLPFGQSFLLSFFF